MAGTLTISTLSDGTNSTSSTNCIQGSAKAWAAFNGNGSVSGLTSYNTSSVTRNSTGNYTINFTTALADASFSAVVADSNAGDANAPQSVACVTARTTTSVTVFNRYIPSGAGATGGDTTYIGVAVFR